MKRTFGQVPNYRRFGDVKKYTRYIDDVFFLFENIEEDQMRRLNFLQLEGLHMGWSYSMRRELFLDLEPLIVPGPQVTRVQTKVYCKPMNRFFNILWLSSDPSSVKKAFEKAELTQFSTVCSKTEYFADTTQSFY